MTHARYRLGNRQLIRIPTNLLLKGLATGYCASFALLCVPIKKGGVFNAAFPLHVKKTPPTIHNPHGNSLEKAFGPALQQQRTALIPCLKMMLAAGS